MKSFAQDSIAGKKKKKKVYLRVYKTTFFILNLGVSHLLLLFAAVQLALVVKNPPHNAEDIKRHEFDPWMGKLPWRRKWQPTPVFLPRESHGQRSLAATVHRVGP